MLFILVHGMFLLSTNLQKDNALRTGHTLNISQSDMSANFSSIASNDGDEERSLNRKLEALEFKLRKVKRERDEMAEQTQMLEKKLKKKKLVNEAQKEYIKNQNVLTSELMMQLGKMDPSVRDLIRPELEMCNHCFHTVKKGEKGGLCPCEKIGYCSTTCQKLDWHRRHKCVCPFGVIRGSEDTGEEHSCHQEAPRDSQLAQSDDDDDDDDGSYALPLLLSHCDNRNYQNEDGVLEQID